MNRIRTAIERKRAANQLQPSTPGVRAPAPLTDRCTRESRCTVMHMDSAESAGGRLGAVLVGPRTGVMAPSARCGPWLATTPALARAGPHRPGGFDFPGDVSRSGDLSGSRGDTRSGHTLSPRLARPRWRGVAQSSPASGTRAWTTHERDTTRRAVRRHGAAAPSRRAVHDSGGAAVARPRRARRGRRPGAQLDRRPGSGHRRPTPARRWSRASPERARARLALEDVLAASAASTARPRDGDHAGRRHPGADRRRRLLLAWLADHPRTGRDPVHVVWETLRLTPPTWITARITTREVDLGGSAFRRARRPGQSAAPRPADELVPGDPKACPLRSRADGRAGRSVRAPGFPFGAGPHACPGRHLGIALLTHLAGWGLSRTDSRLSERVSIDQSRGIATVTVPFHHRPRRSRPRDRARLPAGRLVTRTRLPPAPPTWPLTILAGDTSVDDAIAAAADHLLTRRPGRSRRDRAHHVPARTTRRVDRPRRPRLGPGVEASRRARSGSSLPPGAGPEAGAEHALVSAGRPARRRVLTDRELLPPEAAQDRDRARAARGAEPGPSTAFLPGCDVRQHRHHGHHRRHWPSRCSRTSDSSTPPSPLASPSSSPAARWPRPSRRARRRSWPPSSSSARWGTSCVRRSPRSSATPRACSTTPSTGPPTTSRPA